MLLCLRKQVCLNCRYGPNFRHTHSTPPLPHRSFSRFSLLQQDRWHKSIKSNHSVRTDELKPFPFNLFARYHRSGAEKKNFTQTRTKGAWWGVVVTRLANQSTGFKYNHTPYESQWNLNVLSFYSVRENTSLFYITPKTLYFYAALIVK